MARDVESSQLEIGQTAIAQIQFDPKSRDDIPKILRGLQYIYITDTIRQPIFKLLEEQVLPGIDKKNGRPGMSLWKILVMGVLRLDLHCDYDRLAELVNHHDTVRHMLGHADYFDKTQYNLQTIKDNVRLLTPELLEAINEQIVKAGHELLSKKKRKAPLRGRCDSFVLKTNVHYPTDINLLYDAIRKVIQLTARWCERHGLSDWRQHQYNVKQIKKALRLAQQKKRASGRTAVQKENGARALRQAHQEMLNLAQHFLKKSTITKKKTGRSSACLSTVDLGLLDQITEFTAHAHRQMDQIKRRVLLSQVIPHEEKVFSLFEPHTEWICKGKAGVPVELGLRVCVLEDQHQFILHHQVMEQQTDADVAVPMVKKTKAMFAHISSCSFDKGFHSPENQRVLSEQLDTVALKRKGKLSKTAQAIESSDAFKKAHYKHSAVESAINGLEVHGLAICRDHGMDGFKRYATLAVMTRNIHRIGELCYQKEQKRLARKKRHYQDREFVRLAA